MSAVVRGDAQAHLIGNRILFRNGCGIQSLGCKQCCPRVRLWPRCHLCGWRRLEFFSLPVCGAIRRPFAAAPREMRIASVSPPQRQQSGWTIWAGPGSISSRKPSKPNSSAQRDDPSRTAAVAGRIRTASVLLQRSQGLAAEGIGVRISRSRSPAREPPGVQCQVGPGPGACLAGPRLRIPIPWRTLPPELDLEAKGAPVIEGVVDLAEVQRCEVLAGLGELRRVEEIDRLCAQFHCPLRSCCETTRE